MAIRVSDEQQELNGLVEQIQHRCDEVGLTNYIDDDGDLAVEISAGRKKRTIYLIDVEDCLAFSSIPFEQYIFLSGYSAIASYKQSTIEAEIGSLNLSTNRTASVLTFRELFNLYGPENEEFNPKDFKIEIVRRINGAEQTIIIGSASENFKAMRPLAGIGDYDLTITIKGVNISQHDQTVKTLEKISNSVFYQIDSVRGLPLYLLKERKRGVSRRRANAKDPITWKFPALEYDSQPISLYWYARGARALPLLQFLAFYQCIEFYFPIYSQSEAKRKVQNIIKSPSFSVHNDSDVIRLLNVMKGNTGRGFSDEKSQLKSTLQDCIDNDELRDFLVSDEGRKKFFLSDDAKKLARQKLSLSNTESDLRAEVSERIYDIRCRIVHTKTGGDGEVELLLPFSKEAEILDADLELVQYIARNVLNANSRELVL